MTNKLIQPTTYEETEKLVEEVLKRYDTGFTETYVERCFGKEKFIRLTIQFKINDGNETQRKQY